MLAVEAEAQRDARRIVVGGVLNLFPGAELPVSRCVVVDSQDRGDPESCRVVSIHSRIFERVDLGDGTRGEFQFDPETFFVPPDPVVARDAIKRSHVHVRLVSQPDHAPHRREWCSSGHGDLLDGTKEVNQKHPLCQGCFVLFVI